MREVHLILDNYGPHTHANARAWLAARPNYHLHFTPTGALWLNLVERLFAEITERRIRRGTFRSVPELIRAITSYIGERNKNPKPFQWTARPKDVIRKARRARRCLANSEAGHQHFPDAIADANLFLLERRPAPGEVSQLLERLRRYKTALQPPVLRKIRNPFAVLYCKAFYHRLAARKGKKRAIVAVVHALFVSTGYVLIWPRRTFSDLDEDYFDRLDRRQLTKRLIKRLEKLGYQVSIQPTSPEFSGEKCPIDAFGLGR